MKLIIITSPDFIPDEARIVTELFKAGLDLLHVRKPDADVHAVENLLQGIAPEYRTRIVIHDFFFLKDKYLLGGIHLNSRHPEAPANYEGILSRACHSLEEVETTVSLFNYVLMSPVYDSISKQGYLLFLPLPGPHLFWLLQINTPEKQETAARRSLLP